MPHFRDSGHGNQPNALGMASLREIQARNRGNPDVRALLLEIKRLHGVVYRTESLRGAIDRAWKDKVGGQLAGLFALRTLLMDEPCIRDEKNRP